MDFSKKYVECGKVFENQFLVNSKGIKQRIFPLSEALMLGISCSNSFENNCLRIDLQV